MEFPYFVTNLLQCDDEGFSIIDGQQPMLYRKSMNFNYGIINAHRSSQHFGGSAGSAHLSSDEQLDEIIDKMGMASSKAQRLAQPITTSMKLFNSDNRLYMRAHGKQVVGFIKVGKRNLFIRGDNGGIKEIKPLCVLDFYVHESMQRGGHGKALFDKMLHSEKIGPEKLAYDRPSEKLISFLGKHYGLKKYVPQNNNFVVYDAYWQKDYQAPYSNAGQNPSAYDRFKQNSQQQHYNGGGGDMYGSSQRPPSYRQQEQENMRRSGFKSQQYNGGQQEQQNNLFGQSNQQNMLPPRPHMDARDPRFSSNSQKRELGPRKLSNAGMQVLGGSDSHSQQRYTSQDEQHSQQMKPKKQVSFTDQNDGRSQKSGGGYNNHNSNNGMYNNPQRNHGGSHYQNFQQHQNDQKMDMKTAYQNSIKEKQGQVYSNGHRQGFSDDKVSNLLNLGEFGPLDHANNNARKDVNNHRMNQVNGKINQFDSKIRQQEEALNNFNETVMQKHAAATASNINSFYGKNKSGADGMNSQNDFGSQSRGNNFKTDKNWNHKQAVNELYNKRDQNSYEFYQQNQQVYWKRAEVDKNMVQYNKKMNDGEAGRVPWGTGFSNQNKTTNQNIGSHYHQAQMNGVSYYAKR